MKAFLYAIVEMIAEIHSYLLKMNDAYEYNFSDKELHFLIIGALGMAMIFVVHPLFKWLVKNDHIMVISWIYVFTLIIVITFAIEIGQRVTHTGEMEFADIMFGVLGFISMFLVFSVFRGIYHLILRFIKGEDGNDQEDDEEDEEDEDDGKARIRRRQGECDRIDDWDRKDRRAVQAQAGMGYGEGPYKEGQKSRRIQGRDGYREEPVPYREGQKSGRAQGRDGYREEPVPYREGQKSRRVQGRSGYREEPVPYREGQKSRRTERSGYDEGLYQGGPQSRRAQSGSGYGEEPVSYREGQKNRQTQGENP
ncbi:hypothetical protein [uncultured Acetatifactor sp.]|uniref:hypothetical protein n=1 Tax=uncultured Acetatifactor sp. TaxID=1671927 RepID=UPI0026179AD3|nr:hypothetical protein [uncultured Acetatifactor sp.]